MVNDEAGLAKYTAAPAISSGRRCEPSQCDGAIGVAVSRACVVGCPAAVGEVIAFAEIVRMRRQRVARALHARCRQLIVASVVVARVELETAPPAERPMRLARLRKLEALEEYASALG